MSLNISTDDMFDTIEGAINGEPFENGKSDAVAHVGSLISGRLTPEQLSDIQDQILRAEADQSYVRGYQRAWKAIYDLLY